MKKNPYSLLFGKEPAQSIARTVQFNEIVDSFSGETYLPLKSPVKGNSGKYLRMLRSIFHRWR